MRRCTVGGQAVMEGVMMKSDEGIAMAVRRSDGKIITTFNKQRSKAQKGTFFGWPIIRGVVALIESLSTGMKCTTESAKMYGEDLFGEEEPSKFEKWLSKTFGKSIESIILGIGAVLGVLLAVGLFVFLPVLLSSLIFGESKSIWRSLVEGGLRVAIYVGYLFAMSGIKDMRRLFMYHGAEHKTIACYEAEDELTPHNAMKYRRLHPRCGTNYLFLVMAVSIFVLTIVDVVFQYGFGFTIENKVLAFLFRFGIRILLIPVIAGLSYEVLRWAAKRDNWLTKAVRAPGMGLQLITTKEPTEDMIEVAMAAFYIAMGEKTCEYYNSIANAPAEPAEDGGSEEPEAQESAEKTAEGAVAEEKTEGGEA
jgi:Predicted metal-dependent enzyme